MIKLAWDGNFVSVCFSFLWGSYRYWHRAFKSPIFFTACPDHIHVTIDISRKYSDQHEVYLTSILSGVNQDDMEYYWWLIHETNSPLYTYSVSMKRANIFCLLIFVEFCIASKRLPDAIFMDWCLWIFHFFHTLPYTKANKANIYQFNSGSWFHYKCITRGF